MESVVVTTHLNGEFILHVIPPPMRLDWSTPRSLFIATFLNHIRKDKAPIGHLYVEFTLPKNTATILAPKIASAVEGASRVVTGMSRKKMTVIESIRIVQGKRLGLGTFYYDFKGKLDSVSEAREEIEWARKKNRYAAIRVPISDETSETLMGFLKEWIERGSFRHYSGGLRVDNGEGAGCAEFGMQFLSLALGLRAVHPDWMRQVRVPADLIGGGFAPSKKQQRVSMWNILFQGDRWAFNSEENRVYSIPDPELIFDWIKGIAKNSADLSVVLNPTDITWSAGECQPGEFDVSYERESAGSIQDQWSKISEK